MAQRLSTVYPRCALMLLCNGSPLYTQSEPEAQCQADFGRRGSVPPLIIIRCPISNRTKQHRPVTVQRRCWPRHWMSHARPNSLSYYYYISVNAGSLEAVAQLYTVLGLPPFVFLCLFFFSSTVLLRSSSSFALIESTVHPYRCSLQYEWLTVRNEIKVQRKQS